MTVDLPSDLDEWLDERAEELGVDRETVLVQLLAAYRVAADIEEESAVEELSTRLGDTDEAVAAAVEHAIESGELDIGSYVDVEKRVDDRVSPVEDRIEDLQRQIPDQFEEIRRRLVQVKQTAEEKAPADHTHEELQQLSAVVDRVEALDSAVVDLEDRLDEGLGDLEDRLDEGLGDLEDRLDEELGDLEADTEQLRARLNTVARAVVGLRSRVSAVRARHQETLTGISQRAAAEGIETARCENCENRVTVSLLAEPVCPHCGAAFADIHPSERLFFGVATLETDRPKLEEAPE